MKFLDQVKIYLRSGNGGAGAVSFRREKFIEFGGPDGGNGGKGGDITFKAVRNLNTLIDYRYTQHFKAPTGGHGMGRLKSGKHGEDLQLLVPVGTQIFNDEDGSLIADMLEDGKVFTILKGGDGGFGNAHYKSSVNRAPDHASPGWPGEEMWVRLQLKLIANIGLLGLPNAGKSTFLSTVTRARPKIADYPFTTLHPQLGIITVGDKEWIIADLPGLIEGAHLGQGLGHRFLGHVERCQLLLHLIDASQEDVVSNYKTIRNELKLYGADLSKKKEIIALTKIDLVDQDELKQKIQALKKVKGVKEIHTISSAAHLGIKELSIAISKEMERLDDPSQDEDSVALNHDWHPLD